MDKIIALDKKLLIFLNNLGSKSFDDFWLATTNQYTWIPLFLIILFLIYAKFGIKKGVFILLFITLLVAFSDQFTNLIKNTTERLRPCNTESLQPYLRQFSYKPGGYSFWSGHASLSVTFSVFIILLFRTKTTYIYWLLVFPIFFGLSRIYLAVHYPLDIISGYLAGIILGSLFYQLFKILYKPVFKENIS